MNREQCIRCSIKHLGQAKILMDEARLGYPQHVWYAMSHMAEAEAECVDLIPEQAAEIRAARLMIQDSLDDGALYIPNFTDLMLKVGEAGMLPETDDDTGGIDTEEMRKVMDHLKAYNGRGGRERSLILVTPNSEELPYE